MTGATGFVGRRLVQELQARGWRVRRVLRGGEGAVAGDFVAGDLTGDVDWSALVAGNDVVFHLAARVHVMGAAERTCDPYLAMNVEVTERLARAAVEAGVPRIVFLSSLKAAAEEGEGLRERDEPRPVDPYGISKLAAERQLTAVTASSGTTAVSLRAPLVYGPHVRANFRSLLRWIASGWPLPLGLVRNRRSFLFVGNLVDALIHSAGAVPAGTYYVSDGEDLSTPELIRAVAHSMARPVRLLPVPLFLLALPLGLLGRGGILQRLTGTLSVDGTAFRSTGWTPPYSVARGLAETVAWYQSSQDEPQPETRRQKPEG